jgi:3-oxoacyl-[acyl-carrier protein] reductase
MDASRLAEVVDEANTADAVVQPCALNVADPTSVQAFVDTAVSSFGRLDGLVTSAGITRPSPAVDMPLADWDQVLSVNLTGTFLCVQAATRAMLAAGTPGSVVTISSSLALTGQRHGVHYAASKAGVIALTKTFALELGPNHIRVNNIAPGATETPLLRRTVSDQFLEQWIARAPLGRLGEPMDHARCACFLLSDDSDWITGQTFHVNGGSIMP